MVKTNLSIHDQNQAERLNQLVDFRNLYSQENKLAFKLNCFWSMEVWKILQFDWLRTFRGNVSKSRTFLNIFGSGFARRNNKLQELLFNESSF